MIKTRKDLSNEVVRLEIWDAVTQQLAEEFTLKVFGNDNICDMYWVANSIGSVLCVGGHFVDMYRIVEYFRYNSTPEQFFEYYDWELELAHEDKRPPLSFINFVKYGKGEMK